MANIDRIVSVQIALNTAGISKEGFSTLLIVGESTNALARVSSYTSSVQMTEDGYSETDPLYLMAADFFAQIPHPNVLKVGRRQVDIVQVTTKICLPKGGLYPVRNECRRNQYLHLYCGKRRWFCRNPWWIGNRNGNRSHSDRSIC